MIGKNIDLVAVGFLLLTFGFFSEARHSFTMKRLPSHRIVMPSSFRHQAGPVLRSLVLYQD